MSKVLTQGADTIFPGAGTAASAGADAAVGALTPDMPAQNDLPVRGADVLPKQTEQIATREQQARVALAASGITKTENERDKLGGNTRTASRALLGGR